MSLERCVHSGHCLHRADGALFVRHSQNPRGLVPVACCYCDKRANLEAYARGTVPPAESSYAIREHGPFLPGSPSAEQIAATSDEELVAKMLAAHSHAVTVGFSGGYPDKEVAEIEDKLDTSKAAVLARLAALRREKGNATAEVIR